MYQSSPGGQSSCSSEPSPLGSATNNDSGVEMAALSGGSLGDLSTLDDLPLIHSLAFEDPSGGGGGGVAAVGVHLRKQLGSSQLLEHLKKEKLKTVRDSCRWANNPTPPSLAPSCPPCQPAVRSLLNCPRVGGGPLSLPGSGVAKPPPLEKPSERRDSTSSTLSSAYSLSRRSSGISPCSSSRRSSQASQCGANRPSALSSADSYDPISADISRRSSQTSQCGGGGAGACGGGDQATPLSLTPAQHYRLKMKYAAATGGAPPTPLPYMDQMFLKTHSALYGDPQEPPPTNKGPPSRQCSNYTTRSLMPHEVPSSLPRRASDPVRRAPADSLSRPQMQRYNSMGALHGGAAMQPYSPHHASQLSCQRHPFGLRPPSISENVSMETTAGEDDLVLPDFSADACRASAEQTDFHGNQNLQQPSPGSAQPESRAAALSVLTRDSRSHFPVSLGLTDVSRRRPEPLARGNLAVLQQNQSFVSVYDDVSSNRQMILATTTQQRVKQPNTEPSQCRFNRAAPPYNQNGNASYATAAPVHGSTLSPALKREPVVMETADAFHGFQPVQIKTEECDVALMMSHQHSCDITSHNPLQTGTQSHLQPRPPAEPKPHSRHLSGAKATQQTRILGVQSYDSAVYYTGQIQVFEPSGTLDLAPVLTAPPCDDGPDDQQPSRAADCTLQIDFDSMLDDGDRSSLVSGALSPALLQNLSRSSSRLTTPSNSVTLPSVPAGTGNMAIGDMSSLLTALAEENKFLNSMS
ncbi:hypothetical protein INR49_009959 [Caranx melampygus]|nr:hypothetical protein INR49_009959 [Caranx melampygus]